MGFKQLIQTNTNNLKESLAKENNNFAKSKIYRYYGEVQSALKYLEDAFLEKNVFSFYYLYFYFSGIIGGNQIIKEDKIYQDNLLYLMKENLNFIENEATEKCNSDAIYILGILYFNGIFYDKSFQKAKEILLKDSEQNCSFCLNLLGCIFEIEKNSVCAKFYFKAMEQNFFNAKVNYALITKNGTYVKQNTDLFVEILTGLADEPNDFYLAQY